MEDPATRYMSRTAMNTEVRRPFSVMVNMPNCTRVSPPSVRNRFITTVNRSRITTGFRPLRMYLSGTFDSRDHTAQINGRDHVAGQAVLDKKRHEKKQGADDLHPGIQSVYPALSRVILPDCYIF